MSAVYLFILVSIIIYYVTKPTPNKKQNYRVAKAGDVDHISPLAKELNDLSNKTFYFNGENVNINDYEVFVVDGESMSNCGIHTDNGVLVSCLFDKQKIDNGTIVIYEIDSTRYAHTHPNAVEPQSGFKIRQFLGYADLSNNNQEIYESVKNIDVDLNDMEFKNLLFSKLDKARNYFHNQMVTISITYKDETKDYSIHSLSELYGIVRYIIPESYIKN